MPDHVVFGYAHLKLLDFGFLELHVLADNRVVFFEYEFLGLGARVFLGHVEEARIRRGQKLDLDHGGFGHFSRSGLLINKKSSPPEGSRRGRIALQHTCATRDVKTAKRYPFGVSRLPRNFVPEAPVRLRSPLRAGGGVRLPPPPTISKRKAPATGAASISLTSTISARR